MTAWFRRFADVPGVEYAGPADIRRSRLPGHRAVPNIEVYDFDGERRESLWWPGADGRTTQSPVNQYLSRHERDKEEPADAVLRRLHEAVELPGTPSDYHFAIQGCIEELWRWQRRREQPSLLTEIEKLCWLDIRLVEAQPHIIAYERNGEKRFASVLAFGHLIQLHEREGFLREALDVAERAARFDNAGSSLESLRQRVAQVESEEDD